MGVLNSFFWLVYGLALRDMVIFLPNFSGFLLSMVQICLCLVFPRAKQREDVQMSEQLVDNSNETSINENCNESPTSRGNNLEML